MRQALGDKKRRRCEEILGRPITHAFVRGGTGVCVADSTVSLNIFNEKDLTLIGTGMRRQMGAQVSGGTEAVRYFFSAEDEKETGVLSLPQFERDRFASSNLPLRPWTSHPNVMARKSLRMNLNSAISPKLDLAVATTDQIHALGHLHRGAAGTVAVREDGPGRAPVGTAGQQRQPEDDAQPPAPGSGRPASVH